MYVKHIIRLLAEKGRLSGYEIARNLEAGSSSVWYSLKRLRDAEVITENNELTELGWRVFNLMEATARWVSREKYVSRFGLDAIETANKLEIIFEKANAIIIKEIKDPTREEILADKRESNASQLAVRVFNVARRTARNWPGVAECLQRRRRIFNERLNFWFLGDLPPAGPPFPPVSPDSAIEHAPQIRRFFEGIGPFATCPKCNILILFPHRSRRRCPKCGTRYFRDDSGNLIQDPSIDPTSCD